MMSWDDPGRDPAVRGGMVACCVAMAAVAVLIAAIVTGAALWAWGWL